MSFFELKYNDGNGAHAEFRMSHLNATIAVLVLFALGVFYQYGQEIAAAWRDFRAAQQIELEVPDDDHGVSLSLADIAGVSAPEREKKKPAKKAAPPPVSLKVVRADFSSQSQYDYVKRFAQVAVGEQSKYGIPASIKLAQGILESSSGTSNLAKRNNNHFGVKCFRTDCPKGHCTNHHDDSHKDFFRKYESAWESWREHSERVTSGRYAHIGGKCGRGYKCWAAELKAAGYATSPTYAEKLVDLIDDLKLWRFDQGHVFEFR